MAESVSTRPIMNRRLSFEEKNEIATNLVDYHSVFYEFWHLVTPRFTTEIPTAAVALNAQNRCLDFLINKEFWDSCNDEKKLFVISHECYHIINQTGKRLDGKCDEAKNVAADIPINEGLAKYFGFNRKNIDPEGKLCWLDTIFPDDLGKQLGRGVPKAEPNRSFEYYYDLLKQQGRIKFSGFYFNNHDKLPGNGQGGKGENEALEEFVDSLIDKLDEASADSLKEILHRQEANENKGDNGDPSPTKSAGNNAAGIIKKIEKKFVKPKPKWERIIKNWARKLVQKEFEVSHWLVKNRRYSMMPSDLMLPNDIDFDDKKVDKEKQQIFVVMDASGSCWHYATRFYKTFDSIPRHIKVRLFSFDTYCVENDKKERKVVGGGGTSFHCIEDKIQKIMAEEKIQYPRNIFVFTDGYAPPFQPEKPKNWTWFLTEGGSDAALPQQSKIYDLSEYE